MRKLRLEMASVEIQMTKERGSLNDEKDYSE
jgi:hypothetical protein